MDDNLLLILTYATKILGIIIFPLLFRIIKEYRLEKWIKILVNTAEQIYQDLDGAERLAWVKDQASKKFKIKPEDLDIMIEAFVNEMNIQKDKNNNIDPIINNIYTEEYK